MVELHVAVAIALQRRGGGSLGSMTVASRAVGTLFLLGGPISLLLLSSAGVAASLGLSNLPEPRRGVWGYVRTSPLCCCAAVALLMR